MSNNLTSLRRMTPSPTTRSRSVSTVEAYQSHSRLPTGASTSTAPCSPGRAQGAPESPTIYAGIMEDIIHDARQELQASQRPAGIPLSADTTIEEVERANDAEAPTDPTNVVYLNFADDYAHGATRAHTCYAITMLARHLRPRGQQLKPTKCEYMQTGDVATTCMRIWKDHELDHYIATGLRPLDQYDPEAPGAHRWRQRRGRPRTGATDATHPDTDINPIDPEPPAQRADPEPRPAATATAAAPVQEEQRERGPSRDPQTSPSQNQRHRSTRKGGQRLGPLRFWKDGLREPQPQPQQEADHHPRPAAAADNGAPTGAQRGRQPSKAQEAERERAGYPAELPLGATSAQQSLGGQPRPSPPSDPSAHASTLTGESEHTQQRQPEEREAGRPRPAMPALNPEAQEAVQGHPRSATPASTGESKPQHSVLVQSVVVLGSLVVPDRRHVRLTVDHRIARAWHAYSLIRLQLAQRRKPTLLWGLETVSLPHTQRRALTAVQRTMVKRTAHWLRRPREPAEAFYRRRERLAEHSIVTHMRAHWGNVQR